MKKLYESKNYVQPVKMLEVLNSIPEEVEWSQVKVIPVYATYGEFGLSEMVGFKFVAYENDGK